MATAFILFTLKWQFSKDLELQSGFWLHSFLIDHVVKKRKKQKMEETPENSNLSEVFVTHFLFSKCLLCLYNLNRL